MREKHLQWIYLRPFANAAPLPFHPIDPFPLSIFHSAHTHNPAFIAHLLTLFSVAATTLLCVHLVNCSLTTGCTDSHLGLGCGKLSGTSQQSFYQVHHLIFAQKRLQTRLCVCLCWWPPSVVFVSEQKSWRVFCNNLCVCVCVCVCVLGTSNRKKIIVRLICTMMICSFVHLSWWSINWFVYRSFFACRFIQLCQFGVLWPCGWIASWQLSITF